MPDSKPTKKLGALSITVLLLCVLLLNAGMLTIIHLRYQDSYAAAQVDKIALLENTASPRIIFVGGSNVAFGVDSAMVQATTGYHVVNMGLNGNLGLRYMLSVVQAYVQPGDLVVIMPEYQQFLNDNDNLGPIFVQMLIANPELVKYLSSPKEIVAIAQLFPYVYTQAFKSIIKDIQQRDCIFCPNDEQIYYRAAFNAYGDVISHEKIHPTREIGHLYLSYTEDNPNIHKATQVINQFVQETAQQQVITLMLYPATPFPSENTLRVLEELEQELNSQLSMDVVGSLQDAWYSRALFFDTCYHLIPAGRELNTERILELISPYLEPISTKE